MGRFVCFTPTLFWTVVIGFVEHLHSRNQMDMARLEDALLGARIVTSWGWNIPMMSEPVDSYDGEREKLDCEMNAFRHLGTSAVERREWLQRAGDRRLRG